MPTSVYYIPSGPRNLAALFPSLNWSDIDEYYITVGSIATTPIFDMLGCEDDVRLHFVNYLGGIDSIAFKFEAERQTSSTTYQRPVSIPFNRALPGITRLNIRSTDVFTFTAIVDESQTNWADEIYDSPLAWIEHPGMSDQYIPLLITDQKRVKYKLEDRFSYEIILECQLSHERMIISN
jgi:hypothetical protein